MKKKRKYTKHSVFIWFAALVLLMLQLVIQGPTGRVRVEARQASKLVAESGFMRSGLCMPSRSGNR